MEDVLDEFDTDYLTVRGRDKDAGTLYLGDPGMIKYRLRDRVLRLVFTDKCTNVRGVYRCARRVPLAQVRFDDEVRLAAAYHKHSNSRLLAFQVRHTTGDGFDESWLIYRGVGASPGRMQVVPSR